jgi:putative ABC transport system permease protein
MAPIRPRVRAASAGFLTAMGIRVIAGREFSPADTATAPPVIVMNRSAARHFFGSTAASPVGQVLEWNVVKERIPVVLIGIVEEIRNETLAEEPVPEIFVEYRQMLALAERWGDPSRRRDEMAIGFLSFAVRTRSDPASAIPEIGRIARAVDANAGIDAIAPLEHLMASSVARPRFYAILLGGFATVAAFLAVVGVYGVLAYAVIQRTQEIGIRMALGAQRSQVLGLVLRRGVALTIFGIALGMAGAAAAAPLLQSQLFGVMPLDMRTFAVVAVLFAAVAVAASCVPARRAMKVDPVIALRVE